MNLTLGGLYVCSFDRELWTRTPSSRTTWKVVGVMRANTPFVLVEINKNVRLINHKSKRGDYLDIKILTNQGEIRYIFCFSDIIFKAIDD